VAQSCRFFGMSAISPERNDNIHNCRDAPRRGAYIATKIVGTYAPPALGQAGHSRFAWSLNI
jgi:hypothetical protein